jgi:hypothetical protein
MPAFVADCLAAGIGSSRYARLGPVTEAEARALDPERRAKRKEAEERNAALIARLLDGAREGEVQWPPTPRATAGTAPEDSRAYEGRVSFHLIAVCGETVPLFLRGNLLDRATAGALPQTGEVARNKSCSQSWIIDRDGRT